VIFPPRSGRRRERATLVGLIVLTLAACSSPEATLDNGGEGPLAARVVTFNTGTPNCSCSPDAEYSCEDAAIASEWCGTALAPTEIESFAHLPIVCDVIARVTN
jgi:hypothetical protein